MFVWPVKLVRWQRCATDIDVFRTLLLWCTTNSILTMGLNDATREASYTCLIGYSNRCYFKCNLHSLTMFSSIHSLTLLETCTNSDLLQWTIKATLRSLERHINKHSYIVCCYHRLLQRDGSLTFSNDDRNGCSRHPRMHMSCTDLSCLLALLDVILWLIYSLW